MAATKGRGFEMDEKLENLRRLAVLKPTVDRIAGNRVPSAVQEQLDQLGIAGIAHRFKVHCIDPHSAV